MYTSTLVVDVEPLSGLISSPNDWLVATGDEKILLKGTPEPCKVVNGSIVFVCIFLYTYTHLWIPQRWQPIYTIYNNKYTGSKMIP